MRGRIVPDAGVMRVDLQGAGPSMCSLLLRRCAACVEWTCSNAQASAASACARYHVAGARDARMFMHSPTCLLPARMANSTRQARAALVQTDVNDGVAAALCGICHASSPVRVPVRSLHSTGHDCSGRTCDGPSIARPIALPLLRRVLRDQYFFSRLIIQVWSLPLSPSVMPRYSRRVDRPCSVSNAAPMPTIRRLRSNALCPVR